MSQDVTVSEPGGLSDMQERLVTAILGGASNAEAFERAGYSDTTKTRVILRSPAVQNALRIGRAAIIQGELSNDALKAMRELLESKTPAATRFATAKWVLEHGQAEGDDDGTPLHEMTPAQLQRFMARAQAVIDEGGEPPIINVTPSDGA